MKSELPDSVKRSNHFPELLFNAGFDGTTRIGPAVGPYFHGAPEQYEDLIGSDPGMAGPNTWENIKKHPNLGDLRLYYEGGNSSQRSARIIPDEANPSNKVLRFEIVEPNITIHWPQGPQSKSRVQSELYGNTNLSDLYQSVRMRLHPDLQDLEQYPVQFGWFTLFEFWNEPGWVSMAYPFRMSIALGKPDAKLGTKLRFHAEAQKQVNEQSYQTVWHEHADDFEVPYGKWMTLEIYYHEGRGSDGRLYFAVTPDGGERRVLFDVRNCTCHPDNPAPAGMTHYNPMKLYTSAELVEFMRSRGKSVKLDWDDLSFWRGRVPSDDAR